MPEVLIELGEVTGEGEPALYTIRSYALPGGDPVGEYAMTVHGEIFTLIDGGDGLLLAGSQGAEADTATVTAVRPGQAAPLWQRSAVLFGGSPDKDLALVIEEVPVGDSGVRRIWRGIGKQAGEVRWSVGVPVGGHGTISDEYLWTSYPDRLYLLRPDGRLEVRDSLTGLAIAATTTGMPVTEESSLLVAGGVVTVAGRDRTVAFDARTLARRWQTTEPVIRERFPVGCPAVMCMQQMGDGLAGVDPATGRELWRSAGWDSAQRVGDYLLASDHSGSGPVLAVLDPLTGRITARAGARAYGGPGPRPGSAYVFRLQPADGTLLYGVLDPATGQTRVLGSADRVAGDCQFAPLTMVCRRLDGAIVVWRL